MRKAARRVPVLAVHGFDGYAAKAAAELSALTAIGAVALGYYAGDRGFPVTLPGDPATTDTPIDVLGDRLAGHVRSLPGPVDLIGHSMGGLVIAAALHRLPVDAVGRVVMLGVPFGGLPSAVGAEVAQCREMSPGSDWLARAAAAGWRAELSVASEADEAVPVSSALAAGVGRSVLLPRDLAVHHGDLVTHARVLERVRAALR